MMTLFKDINSLEQLILMTLQDVHLQCILDAVQSSSPLACIPRFHFQIVCVYSTYTAIVILWSRNQTISQKNLPKTWTNGSIATFQMD